MRVLVTGGAGFIGSEFVRATLQRRLPGADGTLVTVLDALTYSGRLPNLAPVADLPGFRFVRGDIADPALVDAVMRGHDAVVHFAAETHVDRSLVTPARFARTNVVGTQVLLEAALRHGVRRFVHVSTDEVYGSIDEGSWTEESPVAPNTPYAAAKAGSDLFALAYHHTFGLEVVVTRCTNNYGHHQFPEKLVPLFVTNLLDGRRLPLYGDGGNVRDWMHVSDHCDGIQRVLLGGQAGEVYHIGGGRELTNVELTARLLDAFGVGWEVVDRVPDRKGHDRRYSLDSTKIERELGHRALVDFDEGLARTIDWYRAHPEWWRPLQTAGRTIASVPRRAA